MFYRGIKTEGLRRTKKELEVVYESGGTERGPTDLGGRKEGGCVS